MMLMELGSGGGGGGGVLLQGAVGGGGLSHAPSVASTSVGGGRIRFVRLLRRHGETYGFSLRGGKEHGTGFFISHVEPGSEAYHNGLRAGDQVLRVNNLCVEQAVHREVAAMVQAKNSVILKVRSTGIIPIKENRGDPLTWMVVDDDEELSDNGTETYSHSLPSTSMPETDTDSFQQSPSSTTEPFHQSQSSTSTNDSHARVYITYNAKTGLGCSICKGPPEKNGIFVQSVRAGGVAKEAGLRPGDQILACNDVSFQHLEFAEAVYVLKSSTHLTLDVLRGAGLDLVAGESSGYNSSASSVAGDQTPPSAASSGSSDTSHKELRRRSNSHDSVASRLSAVSRHLTLDRSRGWREIEAEWANAEAEQKRQQLSQSQKNLKTRAQRDAAMRSASRSVGTSRSMSNLLLQEEDEEEETTAFRDAPFATATATLQRNKPVGYKSALRSAVSTSDLRSDHKIALVTSADPHVNNIVVTQGPKDEKDAVSRLEQLSSPSIDSRSSTVSSSASQVTVRSSLGDLRFGTHDSTASINPQVEVQLRELREEQRRLQLEADRLTEDRRRFEEERRGLLRTQSVPLSPTFSPSIPLLINCSTPPSSLSQPPPSPTPSTASGRHTTRVIIKSAPPPPPTRNKKTSLSSTLTRRGNHYRPSPPASPSHSSSSSGVGSSCGSGGPPPRRCKSIGSLSASSGESSLWEESLSHPSAHQLSSTHNNQKAQYSSSFRPSMPPPPTPPKPTSSSSITSPPQAAGGVPPPPPPPPQGAPAVATPSLGNALLREIEKRGEQQETTGTQNTADASARAQRLEDKIDGYKKERTNAAPIDPSKARHDLLMEEFKIAHKRMFKDPLDGKEQPSTAVNTNQIFSKTNLKPVTPKTSQSEQTTLAVSKFLNNNNDVKVEQSSPVISKIITNSKIAKTSTTTTKVVNQVAVNGVNRNTENNFNSKILKGSSANKTNNEKETIIITSADTKVTIGNNYTKPALKQNKDITTRNSNNKSIISNGTHESNTPSVLKLSQQWNERSGGTSNNVSSIKASTRPGVTSTSSSVLPGSTTVEMNEFRPSMSPQPAKTRTPNTYFEVKPKSSNNTNKPLVSINVYPSAMQRPAPSKMDFLPTPSQATDVKTNGNVSNIPNKQSLQTELTSTLNRLPLRQRLIPQDLPEDPPSSTGTSTTNGNILYLYSTPAIYDTNDNIPFNNPYDNSATTSTTLSSKYSAMGTDISSVTFINDVEEGFREGYRDGPPDALAESPPASILKQAPRPTQHKPLHKSISFGDVTTVGDDELTS